MSDTEILDAPVLDHRLSSRNPKWRREYEAFQRLLPELMKEHRGKFVAIHDGAVVAVADTFKDAALQAYSRCGYLPLHVGRVTDQPEPPVRIPSPRIVRSRT